MAGTVAARAGIAVLIAGALLGGVHAQAEPAWADDLFADLEGTAETYNARDDAGAPGLLEGWLLRNARVNLYVTGPGGATAAYSFRVDGQFRVTDLRRGTHEDPTLRVNTSKETVDEVAAAEDTPAAIRRNVRGGRIRVRRVIDLFGLEVAIGAARAAIGVGGVAAVAVAAAKFGGEGLLSLLGNAVRSVLGALARAAQGLWRALGQIAAGLTILDQLGLLDRLRELLGGWWTAIRDRIAAVIGAAGGASSGEGSEEREEG